MFLMAAHAFHVLFGLCLSQVFYKHFTNFMNKNAESITENKIMTWAKKKKKYKSSVQEKKSYNNEK